MAIDTPKPTNDHHEHAAAICLCCIHNVNAYACKACVADGLAIADQCTRAEVLDLAIDAIDREADTCVADDCGHNRCDYARQFAAAIRRLK